VPQKSEYNKTILQQFCRIAAIAKVMCDYVPSPAQLPAFKQISESDLQ
jgi:hypothetical protein